ncbi:hypothetical protein BU17DRAFT_57340, partial [Hysterangium stoloniferum]
DVRFVVNIQHECARALCSNTGSRTEVQEGYAISRKIICIQYNDDPHFIVNLHPLMPNYYTSAPHLTHSTPPANDREVLHFYLAAKLRTVDAAKISSHPGKACNDQSLEVG